MLDVQPELANINRAMTIAGSDSGGGAGLQADLKAFAANGVYGTSVVTTVTSQNTLGVQEVLELPIALIESQIDSVLTDIGTDVVKTGMLYSSDVIRSVAAKINQYDIALLVVDPVMKAKGGAKLINDEAIDTLRNVLLPMATVVTPNAPEAQDLTGIVVDDIDSAREAAIKLVELGAKSAVVKGGHFDVGPATDVLFDGEEFRLFTTRRIDTSNTHGTGCTFASATAAGLAKGKSIRESVSDAKGYVTGAIRNNFPMGNGHGPLNHFYQYWKSD